MDGPIDVMPSLPLQDSSEHVYIGHISQLLLQLMSAMKSYLIIFSLHELERSYDVCLHLLASLLKFSQPSSLVSTPATTPSTPSTPSAGQPMSLARPIQEPATQSSNQEILSMEKLRFKICSSFLSSFTLFLETRVIPSAAHHTKDLHRSLSSACKTLVLVAKLISMTEAVDNSIGEQVNLLILGASLGVTTCRACNGDY
jgi:hypothetical protein